MPDNTEANVATADVLTLLLHNQHALAAAIEEVPLRAKASGSGEAHEHAIAAMETRVRNHRWNTPTPSISAAETVKVDLC